MKLKVARFTNLTLASLLAGNEVGTWAIVHPSLHTLPLPAHIQAEQEITRRYGAAMPVLMPSVILSCIPVLGLLRDRRSAAFRFTVAGMVCYIAMLASTLLGNVPINKRTLEVSADSPPGDWDQMRARWDRLHTLRSILVVAGLSFLLLGSLSRDG